MKSNENTGAISRAGPLPEPREGPHAHILLVDDDPIFRSITRLSLLQIGHIVSVADDSKTALEAAGQNKDIELLITDVVMPGMNGSELARKLRVILPRCKVLYTSGYTPATLATMGATTDSLHFLQKPFRRAELAGCVNTILAGG